MSIVMSTFLTLFGEPGNDFMEMFLRKAFQLVLWCQLHPENIVQ